MSVTEDVGQAPVTGCVRDGQRASAERLHCHYSAARYRTQQVRELPRLSLRSIEDDPTGYRNAIKFHP